MSNNIILVFHMPEKFLFFFQEWILFPEMQLENKGSWGHPRPQEIDSVGSWGSNYGLFGSDSFIPGRCDLIDSKEVSSFSAQGLYLEQGGIIPLEIVILWILRRA